MLKMNTRTPLFLAVSSIVAGEGEIDWANEEARNAAIASQIEEATSGLKGKNDELLGKLAKAKEAGKGNAEINTLLESLGGADGAQALLTMKTALEKDERTKTLLSGDIGAIDALINQDTDAMKANYENQINAQGEKLSEAEKLVQQLHGKINNGTLRTSVDAACQALECLTGVNDDVFREAQSVFSFNEDGQPVIMKDDVVRLGADGKKPMSVQEWLDTTRETSTYRWADSRSGGSQGSGGQGGREVNTDNMPMSEYRKERNAGNVK